MVEEYIGSYFLADVTPSLITEYRNKLVGEVNQFGKIKGVSTVNRYCTALGHVFTIAVKEWEWVQYNPFAIISKLKEPRGRVRFLSDVE